MALPDDTGNNEYLLELLDYAAYMWRVSGSALPPTLDDVLSRDKQWDREVATMRQIHKFYLDFHRRPAADQQRQPPRTGDAIDGS